MVAGSDSCRRDQREDWENILKSIFHCDAKYLALGVGVGGWR